MTRKGKRWRTCRRKIRHLHYLTALLHARLLPHDNLVIYPCPFCHYLHLGRSSKRTIEQQAIALWETKKARLERRIACVQQQLAQLQHNLQELLTAGPAVPHAEKGTAIQTPSRASQKGEL